MKEHRVGNGAAGAMLALALVIDGLQFILTLSVVGSIVASVIAAISAFCFWLWFALLGVKYLGQNGSRKMFIALAASVAELVPFINALPATTIGVLGIIIDSRIEDARTAAGKKVTARTVEASARLARMRAARRARAEQQAQTEE